MNKVKVLKFIIVIGLCAFFVYLPIKLISLIPEDHTPPHIIMVEKCVETKMTVKMVPKFAARTAAPGSFGLSVGDRKMVNRKECVKHETVPKCVWGRDYEGVKEC